MINVLSKRFDGLDGIEYIRNKITVRPPPAADLDILEPSSAAQVLFEAWKTIFIPNKFTLKFIADTVGRAAAHSANRFDTEVKYVNQMYYPTPGEVFPICLSGLAGVGKTQTINALLRVMPEPADISIEHYQTPHTIYSYWYASAREKASGKQLLMNFLGHDGSTRANVANLRKRAQQQANQLGISLVVLDEMQHVSTGQGAAKVTDILLTTSGLDIPMVFVSNFSLIHKLLKRNSEDRQRLLSEPRVMLPDAHDSTAWSDFIRECVSVSNGRVRANFEDFSREVYRASFGIKRLALQLLTLAYLEARRAKRMHVELEDLHRAYLSASYFSSRDDVEELERQAIQPNKMSRLDLRCPFGTPMRSNVIEFARKDRDNRVAEAAFKGSLTASEREAHKSLKLCPDLKSIPSSKRPRIKKPTKESLLNAYNDFFNPKREE